MLSQRGELSVVFFFFRGDYIGMPRITEPFKTSLIWQTPEYFRASLHRDLSLFFFFFSQWILILRTGSDLKTRNFTGNLLSAPCLSILNLFWLCALSNTLFGCLSLPKNTTVY